MSGETVPPAPVEEVIADGGGHHIWERVQGDLCRSESHQTVEQGQTCLRSHIRRRTVEADGFLQDDERRVKQSCTRTLAARASPWPMQTVLQKGDGRGLRSA